MRQGKFYNYKILRQGKFYNYKRYESIKNNNIEVKISKNINSKILEFNNFSFLLFKNIKKCY